MRYILPTDEGTLPDVTVRLSLTRHPSGCIQLIGNVLGGPPWVLLTLERDGTFTPNSAGARGAGLHASHKDYN
jgi:hypothetical protein